MIKHTEVMKLALEALKSCDAAHITDGGRQWYDEKLVDKAVEAIEKALTSVPDWASEAIEQLAQQEPVTWGVDWGRASDIPCVSIIKRMPGGGIEVVAVEYGPQRTWVGLTDEEIRPMCGQSWVFDTVKLWVNVIEAKLREKNAQPSKPLTDEQIDRAIAELGLNYFADAANNRAVLRELCRKAAHGITKEQT